MLPPGMEALHGQLVAQHARPHERMLQVQFVHLAHQRQIGRAVGLTTPPTAWVTIG